MVYVKRLYVSDTSQAVHGRIAASPSGVDDDDEFDWEVHLRAVCLSGFPRRPWGDTGARCGKIKSHRDENLLCTLMNHHTAKASPHQSLASALRVNVAGVWKGQVPRSGHLSKKHGF